MERLQKAMAHRGIASRRKCEDLIQAGRVAVNGEIVRELGTKVSEDDVISLDGREVPVRKDSPVYIILNKPKGYITTVKDPQGRKTVMDLVSNLECRIYPVGRLDYDTEGLLLMTNDGEMSYALTHPSHRVDKTYLALVRGIPSKESLEKLRHGVELEDGITSPAQVELLSKGRQSRVRIIIHEGRKRQVRRMLKAVGHPVLSLRRIQFGPLSLKGLPLGKYRYLTPEEETALKIEKEYILSKK